MNVNDGDADTPGDPTPTCTTSEAQRRRSCLQTAFFHLRLARQALAGFGGTDLTDLDSLIEDTQEALAYYTPKLTECGICGAAHDPRDSWCSAMKRALL